MRSRPRRNASTSERVIGIADGAEGNEADPNRRSSLAACARSGHPAASARPARQRNARPVRRPITAARSRHPSRLRVKRRRQVLGQQHVLVEDDLAPRDPPAAVIGAAQQILALADQDVGLGRDPVAVDQEPAFDRGLARGRPPTGMPRRVCTFEIMCEMRDDRLLGPVDAGLDLLDPAGQRVLALVEPVDVAGRLRVNSRSSSPNLTLRRIGIQ